MQGMFTRPLSEANRRSLLVIGSTAPGSVGNEAILLVDDLPSSISVFFNYVYP